VYLGLGKKTRGKGGFNKKKVFQHIISNNGMLMNNDDDLNYMSMVMLEKSFPRGPRGLIDRTKQSKFNT
jgi:hypothetical protein